MPEPDDPLSSLDFTPICGMQHSANDGKAEATPCDRPAAWIATVHDCTKKRDYPNNGTTLPICSWYLDDLRTREYPYRCPGCAQDITSILMLIWEIQHLHPARK